MPPGRIGHSFEGAPGARLGKKIDRGIGPRDDGAFPHNADSTLDMAHNYNSPLKTTPNDTFSEELERFMTKAKDGKTTPHTSKLSSEMWKIVARYLYLERTHWLLAPLWRRFERRTDQTAWVCCHAPLRHVTTVRRTPDDDEVPRAPSRLFGSIT